MFVKIFIEEIKKSEESIQNWLNLNPNIAIHYVNQIKGDYSRDVITTIFYTKNNHNISNDNVSNYDINDVLNKLNHTLNNINASLNNINIYGTKQIIDKIPEEPNNFTVILTSYIYNKIQVMKVMCMMPGHILNRVMPMTMKLNFQEVSMTELAGQHQSILVLR